jgi:hypothetical protein
VQGVSTDFDTTTISFVLDDELEPGQNPVSTTALDVKVGSRSTQPCTKGSVAPGNVSYSCTYVVAAEDAEGPHFVTVLAKDAAGNQAVGSVSTPIIFDFTPPALVGTGRLIRDDFYRAAQIADDRVALSRTPVFGTSAPTVTVMFVASETLLDASISPPNFSVPGTFDEQAGTGGGFFIFRYTQPVAQADANLTLTLPVRDLAGNPATLTIGQIDFDNTAPALAALIPGIAYFRAPWGNANDAPGTARLVLDTGQQFEPFSELSVFAGAAPATSPLIRQVSFDASGVLHDAGGTPLPIDLPTNVRDVYLLARDRAGNLNGTSALQVKRGVFSASVRSGQVWPHSVALSPHTYATKDQMGNIVGNGTLNAPDGVYEGIRTRGYDINGIYGPFDGFTPVPPPRAAYAGGFDEAAGRLVIFGGAAEPDPTVLGDTWEWTGSSWVLGPAGPQARYGAAMASFYNAVDSAHPTSLIMFGGGLRSGPWAALCDTWRFGGGRWYQVPDEECEPNNPAGQPPPRVGHALVRDPVYGDVLLIGGDDPSDGIHGDAWFYGAPSLSAMPSWVPAIASPTLAPVVTTASAVYDSTHQKFFLFGGRRQSGVSADLWEGTRTSDRNIDWVKRCSTEFLLGFEPSCTSCTCTTGPSERALASAVDAPAFAGFMIYGGSSTNTSELLQHNMDRTDAWVWNGSDWRRVMTFTGCSFGDFECELVRGGRDPIAPHPLHPLVEAPRLGLSFQLDEADQSFGAGLTEVMQRQAERAGLYVRFDLALAAIPRTSLSRFIVRTAAGGTLYDALGDPLLDGVETQVWNPSPGATGLPQGWVSRASAAFANGAPGSMTFDTQVSPVAMSQLVADDGSVAVLVQNQQESTRPYAHDFAEFNADYIELVLHYTLP